MTRKTMLAVLAGVMAFAMAFSLTARMTTPGGETVIARDVIAGGGGRTTDPSQHAMPATIGQTFAGVSTTTSYTLVSGFHVMVPRVPTAARSWHLY